MLTAFVLFVAACVLSFIIYGHHPVARYRLRHIPGPPFIPFKGNVDAIAAAGGLHTAYQAWAAQYGPIFKIFLGGDPVVVITDPAAARTAMARLNTRMLFGSAAELRYERGGGAMRRADMLQTRDATFHHALKKAWLPFFNAGALASFGPAIESATERLVERMADAADAGREINLAALTADWTADLVFKFAFGVDLGAQEDVPPADTAAFLAAVRTLFLTTQAASIYATAHAAVPPLLRPLVRAVATLAPDAPLRRITAAGRVMMGRLAGLIAAARKRAALAAPITDSKTRTVAPGGFLDHLVTTTIKVGAAPPRPLTDAEVLQSAFTMAVAAQESTAATLAFVLYNLSLQPDLADAVAAETRTALRSDGSVCMDTAAGLPLTAAVIRETLRLYPPVTFTTRVADGTLALGGVRLPRGTGVHAASWTLQRDEAVWGQDAAEFRPARFLENGGAAATSPSFIPFGSSASALKCLGGRLAMLELSAALAKILAGARLRFDVAPGQVPLPLQHRITLSARDGIFVTGRRVGEDGKGRGLGPAPPPLKQ